MTTYTIPDWLTAPETVPGIPESRIGPDYSKYDFGGTGWMFRSALCAFDAKCEELAKLSELYNQMTVSRDGLMSQHAALEEECSRLRGEK